MALVVLSLLSLFQWVFAYGAGSIKSLFQEMSAYGAGSVMCFSLFQEMFAYGAGSVMCFFTVSGDVCLWSG